MTAGGECWRPHTARHEMRALAAFESLVLISIEARPGLTWADIETIEEGHLIDAVGNGALGCGGLGRCRQQDQGETY